MSAHANCTHPATKSARAICRRAAQKGTEILTAAQVMPAVEPVEPIVVDDAEEYRRLCDLIEADRNAKKGQVVTRENWREFRDLDVEIIILNNSHAGQAEYVGRIVAWGEKRFSYRSVFAPHSLNHASALLVVSVVAVKDQD